ncbi:MAG TPA: SBBP repeat-containing protein [Bryobacteraceae bacterium]|jgi:uncharacterized protein (TIGR03437 family)|nr:SBBP repeat-containing protein [Bryobacteraceae bacterium]
MKKLGGFAVLFTISAATAGAATRTEYLSRLPLRFEENRGRDGHPGALYMARTESFSLSLAASGNWLDWRNAGGAKLASVHTRLVGANPARLEPADRLPGVANYFQGSAGEWRTDVTGFGRIRYSGVYSGIDLVFHGEEHRLEYDFVVAPHADPGAIQLEISGQKSLRVEDSGDLVIETEAGEIRWKKPEIYQDANGARQVIDGRFLVAGARTVKFEIAAYDSARTLVIDPVLQYSTYLGSTGNDGGRGIGLDSAGNIYIVGNTTSTNLPTVSAAQANYGGMSSNFMNGDAFVVKFSPAGALVYLTYLGGSGDDAASAVAVDPSGNAYVVGATTSTNFPVASPAQLNFGGMGGKGYVRTGDAFVAKLNPTGNRLLYSTYLGGNQDDAALAVAIDSKGDAFVAGVTSSMNFPITANAYQSYYRGGEGEPVSRAGHTMWDPGDVFVAELNPSGSQLVFATYYGGTSDDAAFSIALDSASNIYVGGCTISPDLPTTAGALQRSFGGSEVKNKNFLTGDGFVAKFDPTGSTLMYSTYFGGTGDDCISSIAVDSKGDVYMTGSTSSQFLKTTTNAFQPLFSGYTLKPKGIGHLYGDAFVGELNPAGSELIYLSYLGGSENDGGMAIAIDAGGNAYVTGFTDSTNFPLAGASLQTKMAGDGKFAGRTPYGDAFLCVVNPTGTALLYSSYFGGNFDDLGAGIALDGSGGVYITGETASTTLATTTNAQQAKFGGLGATSSWVHGDAFYAVFNGFSSAGPQISKVANAEGESLTIAANTWVEVKGTGLSATMRTWQTSDFVGNQLPIALDGVSVTLNGENAYVYYISGTQINILTPPDLAAGPVQVVVNNSTGSSAAYASQAAAVSPSFFIFGSGPYIAATHLNNTGCAASGLTYCYVGPTTLYPGYSTPAMGGENIVLYANGLGAVVPPVIKGSLTQTGSLATKPIISIANNPVTVTFAGLISPGLYQFNIVIPPGTPAGDDFITINYDNVVSALGPQITIQ